MLKLPSTGLTNAALKKQLSFLYRLNKALHHEMDENIRLKINILGHRYEIPASILNNYPDTILGEPKLRALYYDSIHDEFIFDRHPQAFESILIFYQSDGNSLARPEWMPPEIFYEELKFFRIKQSILISYYDQEIAPTIDIELIPKHQLSRSIWLITNYATRDWKSVTMRFVDLLLNLISVWAFTQECIAERPISQVAYWIEETGGEVLRPIYKLHYPNMSTAIIELCCTIIFLLQICLRVCLAPTFAQIYSDLCFWLECISILTNLLTYIIINIEQYTQIQFRYILPLLFIVRSLRVLRFARQITGLRVFLRTLVYGISEIFHLFILLIVVLLFFGEIIYVLEEWTSDSRIQTVTDGYWLTILTVTSLGYGDVYPTYIHSRVVMSICSVVGLLFIAMPIPRIYRHFDTIYRFENRKRRHIRFLHADQMARRI